jgi:hypothetical protein
MKDFKEIMTFTAGRLEETDPSLTPEYLMPYHYRSPEANAKVNRDPDLQDEIGVIRNERHRLFVKLAKETALPRLETQTIPNGTLAVPPYSSQDEHAPGEMVGISKGCTGACFRMMLAGITGWAPSQHTLNYQLKSQFGTEVVEDVVYDKLFQTEAFGEMCRRDILTLDIMGADFELIRKLAAKVTAQRPQADVFCMVNLSSLSLDKNVWHSNLLLEADDEKVVTHDPLRRKGAFYEQPYEEFARRWAVAYNRAKLVIAD